MSGQAASRPYEKSPLVFLTKGRVDVVPPFFHNYLAVIASISLLDSGYNGPPESSYFLISENLLQDVFHA